jgi:pyruvate/2-oxoglutarate dehydrogenase complex dihydrolipoamide dehydrogenase (E3) component
MSRPEQYDLVVLGSGRARFLAWELASRGKRAVVVERRNLSGSCPTIACLPSKNVIHGAKVAHYFQRAAEFGIAVSNWNVDMVGVRARKRSMVDGMVELNTQVFRETGAELVMGQGRFVGPKTIEVALTDGATRTLSGNVVVICTGSRARFDAIPGLTEAKAITHIEALELDHVPKHLLILGGGYVGIEFAQALRRFGSRVTVIDRNDTLASHEDPDVSAALRELVTDEGIEIRTSTSVARVEGRSGDSVRLHLTRGGAEEVIEGSDLLVASGRNGRYREGPARFHPSRRTATDHGGRRLGSGRLRWQPPLYAYRGS